MSVLGNVINWILGLGAAIFVPIYHHYHRRINRRNET